MKNEWDIVKASLKLFVIVEVLMIILSFIFQQVGLAIGFIWGYIINLIAFYLMVQTVDAVLLFKSKNVALVGAFYLVRMFVYAVGFFVAVKVEWIHLFTTFIGYFVVKITLQLQKYLF